MNMFKAVSENDMDEMHRLLRMKIDVNQKDPKNDNTPLHIACVRRNLPIITLLLNHGACINQQNKYGYTPLMITMLGDKCDGNAKKKVKKEVSVVMEYLLSKSANPNFIDMDGNTALHLAVRKVANSAIKKDCVKMLIEKGVNVEVINRDEKTAYDITLEWKLVDLVDVFTFFSPVGVALTAREVRAREDQASQCSSKSDINLFFEQQHQQQTDPSIYDVKIGRTP